MRTRDEMIAELGSRLMVASNSTLYTALRKLSLIKSGHYKATAFKDWPDLVRCKTTTTTTDDYYDMPVEFRTDSVVRLVIDGQPYAKKNYQDFLDYINDNAAYLNSYLSGKVLDVYGCIQPEDFADGNATTIFSNSDITGNEAIVKFALAEAIKKSNPALAKQEEEEAKEILNLIWAKVAPRQQGDQRLNRPFLNVPDFFGSNKSRFQLPQQKYIFADYQRKIFIASFK